MKSSSLYSVSRACLSAWHDEVVFLAEYGSSNSGVEIERCRVVAASNPTLVSPVPANLSSRLWKYLNSAVKLRSVIGVVSLDDIVM